MAKMTGFKVYKGTKEAFISGGFASTYAEAIVFITGGTGNEKNSCIFAQGTYFANIQEMMKAINFVKGVKVGTSSYDASVGGGYIPFAAADNSTVALDVQNGTITVGLTDAFVTKVNNTSSDLGTKNDGANKDGSAFARIANLAALVADLTGGSTESIAGQIEAAINALRTEIVGTLGADDAATLAAINDELDGIDAKYAALEPRVKAIEDDYLKGADKTELQNAINTEKGRVDGIVADYLKGADKEALQGAINTEKGRIDVIAPKVETLVGSDANMSARAIVQDEVAKQLQSEKISDSFDTLKEMAEYLSGHPQTVTEMNNAIKQNADDIDAIEKTLETLATSENLGALEVRVKANEDAVATVDSSISAAEGRANAHAESQASAAQQAAITHANTELAKKADKATTYTKTEVDGLVSPKADKSYVDTELGKKANSADVYTKTEVDAMFTWEQIG